MTQAQAEAPAPSAPQGDSIALPAELLEGLSSDLRAAYLADTGAPPAAPSSDADETSAPTATPAQDEAPPADAADGDAEGDAGDEALTPEQRIGALADTLFDTPGAVARLNKADTVAVIEEYNRRVQIVRDYSYEEGVRAGQQMGQQQAQTATLASQALEIDALLDAGEVTAYRDALEKFPGGEQNFHRIMETAKPVVAGTPEYFAAQAQGLVALLDPYPEIKKELATRWNYKNSESELRRLAQDVGALVERGKAQAPNPAQTELQKRQDGLNGLREAPKPDASQGRTAPLTGKLTADDLERLPQERLSEMFAENPEKYARIAAGGSESWP